MEPRGPCHRQRLSGGQAPTTGSLGQQQHDGSGAVGPEDEEEEDSDSSSSSSSSCFSGSSSRFQQSLDRFRDEWLHEIAKRRQELKVATEESRSRPPSSCRRGPTDVGSGVGPPDPQRLDLATRIYREGMREEAAGQHFLAISHYRCALHLVPEIESILGRGQSQAQPMHQTGHMEPSVTAEEPFPDFRQISYEAELDESNAACGTQSTAVDDIEPGNSAWGLIERFIRQRHLEGTVRYCEPDTPVEAGGHISQLPLELLLYIFRWVVGSHLDVRMLDVISGVCRGFYLLARDESLWRAVCQRTWRTHRPPDPTSLGYSSWRQMALLRPHVLFNGCYISHTSYLRCGEPVITSIYRPFFIVHYHRAIRFYPDGSLVMVTAPVDPVHLVKLLGKISSGAAGGTAGGEVVAAGGVASNTAALVGGQNSSMLEGYYWLADNKVTCVLQRVSRDDRDDRKRRQPCRRVICNLPEQPEVTYRLELQLKASKKGRRLLLWKYYGVCSLYRSSGEERVSEIQLSSDKFPAMVFSRVKSFTANIAPEAL